MSEEVKTDAAPAEAPSAEDLKGQKRSIEVRTPIYIHFISFSERKSYVLKRFEKNEVLGENTLCQLKKGTKIN